jgi:hypothetical protein
VLQITMLCLLSSELIHVFMFHVFLPKKKVGLYITFQASFGMPGFYTFPTTHQNCSSGGLHTALYDLCEACIVDGHNS